MANSIVQVNVSVQVSPTPATLQRTGAMVSHGGSILSPGASALLTQLSDLTPYLRTPATLTTVVWVASVVTATTASAHNLPIGQVLEVTIAGVTPAGFNGTYQATVTTATAFTYALSASPGTQTVAGTWTLRSAAVLSQMATTYFAQSSPPAVYIFETGALPPTQAITFLAAYITANPNVNYTPGATGYFYSYLLPRSFDGNAALISLLASYQSTTARTYFFITTNLTNYTLYNSTEKDAVLLVESPAFGVWASNVLTAASYSAGAVTATTTSAHNVSVGQWFQITGMTPTTYNGWWQAATGTTGSTLVWSIASNPGTQTVLGSLLPSYYSNAGALSTEFSAAAAFAVSLSYNPSTTQRVTPYQFSFLYGVTPFPVRNFGPTFTALKAASVNWVTTGAEGGISQSMLVWGLTADAQQFTYWYSVDWVQINLDLDTANEVINGSNDPINPLYYNQPGIDRLQGRGASTLGRGVTYGLVLGKVVQTALDGYVLRDNLDQGLYANQTVINAVPFVTYSGENPSDYALGKYAGLSVVYQPQLGFEQIIYNVVVTELVGY